MIQPWHGEDFGGAKLALIRGTDVLTYRRDNKPDIPYPDYWDLPGGGREGTESPSVCALRELFEEFGLTLPVSRLTRGRRFDAGPGGLHPSYFFIGHLDDHDIQAIAFGDEGQYWRMMPLIEFLYHDHAVPALQERLLMLYQG
ncbi:MAG: NUDIX hydrolase [Pseudomonadota bacterium]